MANGDLSVPEVKAIKTPGYHRVSSHLYLQVSKTGTRSWIHQHRHEGRSREMGLGPCELVTLADAREKVLNARRLLLDGQCPIAAKKFVAPVRHTFRDVATAYVAAKQPEWTNAKYARQVVGYLESYVYPKLGDMDVAQITTADVHGVLSPIWRTKTTTGVALRGYCEKTLAYAKAMKWRDGLNPAAWAENLEFLLASPGKISQPKKHPSLHHTEIGEFMTVLRAMEGDRYRLLETAILCGLRSNEAQGARWCEIDLDAATWTIPAERMKERVGHVAPLSPRMVEIFRAQPRTGELVFTLQTEAEDLRDAMRAVEKRAGRVWLDRQSGRRATPHGFRASFSTWGSDKGYDPVLIEVALAHAVGTEVSRRYQRGDKIELRRELMTAWASVCGG